jgi:dTDP-4-dehydrorhamnose reductase
LHGQPAPELEAIATTDWPTPARRPADSRLDVAKLKVVFNLVLPPWQESLSQTVDEIFASLGDLHTRP